MSDLGAKSETGLPVRARGLFNNDEADTISRLRKRLAREKRARKEAEAIAEKATRVSIEDPLTALANRSLIMDNLERELNRARRSQGKVGLLFIDLDGFKHVNDTYGHSIGDQLLIAVAAATHQSVRSGDLVGRLGGDEFVVILPNANLDTAGKIADRITQSTQQAGRDIQLTHGIVSCSIGVTILDGSVNADESLRQADLAMYQAKRERSGQWRLFDEELEQSSDQQRSVRRDLPGAIERRELSVHYQPIVDLETYGVSALEALVRWPQVGSEDRSPVQFIGPAEESGAIHALGELVLTVALSDLAEFHAQNEHRRFPVTINVSPYQLRQPHFASTVQASLGRSGLDGSALIVEMTESAIYGDETAIAKNLGQLRRSGVQLALDDFGTGHSSLARLRSHEFDILKIDRSFIKGVVNDPDDRSIVKAVVALAHALDLKVIAEGVETFVQLDAVQSLGVDAAQGFLFDKPAVLDELPNVGLGYAGLVVDRGKLDRSDVALFR